MDFDSKVDKLIFKQTFFDEDFFFETEKEADCRSCVILI